MVQEQDSTSEGCRERPHRREHVSQPRSWRGMSCAMAWGRLFQSGGWQKAWRKEQAKSSSNKRRTRVTPWREHSGLCHGLSKCSVKYVAIRTENLQTEATSPTEQKPEFWNSFNKCTKQVGYGGMTEDEESCSPWANNLLERKNTSPKQKTLCNGWREDTLNEWKHILPEDRKWLHEKGRAEVWQAIPLGKNWSEGAQKRGVGPFGFKALSPTLGERARQWRPSRGSKEDVDKESARQSAGRKETWGMTKLDSTVN